MLAEIVKLNKVKGVATNSLAISKFYTRQCQKLLLRSASATA